MPKKTKQGWVAPLPGSVQYRVNMQQPTGVFVQFIKGSNPSLQYAGAGTAAGPGFELPYDADFLRDIADALNRVADEIDN